MKLVAKWKLKKQRRKATLRLHPAGFINSAARERARAADASGGVSPFALVSELSRVLHVLIEREEISLFEFLPTTERARATSSVMYKLREQSSDKVSTFSRPKFISPSSVVVVVSRSNMTRYDMI